MRIGEYQVLVVNRESPHGFYLGDGEVEVLLPIGQCHRSMKVGDSLRVFVYTDSEDRPVATVKHPRATIGEFAKLRVVSVTGAGAFLDWGIDKDLFCPMREQQERMREGFAYVVRVYLDEVSHRVVCSSRIDNYLVASKDGYEIGQEVKILIAERAPDRIRVIIDDAVKGSIFADEWHERLELGETRRAYIKQIRPEDGRIAISLRPQGYEAVLESRDRIINTLTSRGGTLAISDKSSPADIHALFGLSKGAFKKLIGTLYKEGLIRIEPEAIHLIKHAPKSKD